MRLYLKRQFTKICAGLLLLLAINMDAQDPIYSQYYTAPLQLNPAFAGNTDYPLFHANYRLQWPAIAQLSSGILDVSSGILFYSPLYYVGLSFKHINTPENSLLGSSDSFVGLPTRFSLHGGMQINFDRGNKRDEGSFISPNVLLLNRILVPNYIQQFRCCYFLCWCKIRHHQVAV